MPHSRWTGTWLHVVLVAVLAASALLGATSCGLLPKQPAAPPPATQPPQQQPPAQPPVTKPPEPAPSVVTLNKPAPVFQLKALGSAETVRFPDAFRGKVVALEFFSTG